MGRAELKIIVGVRSDPSQPTGHIFIVPPVTSVTFADIVPVSINMKIN